MDCVINSKGNLNVRFDTHSPPSEETKTIEVEAYQPAEEEVEVEEIKMDETIFSDPEPEP